MLEVVIARVTRTLVRGGVLVEEAHPYLDLPFDSPLEQLSGAAVCYQVAVGPQAGRNTMRLRDPSALAEEDPLSKPFTVARDGFSINAAVVCEAHARTKLERVCRYMDRPAIAERNLTALVGEEAAERNR